MVVDGAGPWRHDVSLCFYCSSECLWRLSWSLWEDSCGDDT